MTTARLPNRKNGPFDDCGEGEMKHKVCTIAVCAALACVAGNASGQQNPPPKGVYSFGADQTIADIGKMEWAPLKLEGLPAGIEIAVLRGDLAKGGGEILLRTPPNYVVPNHSHTSDEVYLWLKGTFTYIAADGTRQKMEAPAYISLPGQSPHALECGEEQCVFYLRYGRPFDLHVHAMAAPR
jgi:quercetin dioxygenase-like cupin family protein